MQPQTPDRPTARESGSERSGARTAVIVLVADALLSTGWFLLSWLVAHNSVGDAVGEALGVALGLLIVYSVVGAIRGRDRSPDQGG